MGDLYERLQNNPVIAAVKDGALLKEAVQSPCDVLFLLTGNICTIEDTVEEIHRAGKEVYIHIDLMEGFGRDRHAIRYIRERIAPDGIITTKTSLVKIAREMGLFAIQRMFLVDRLSFESGIAAIHACQPDAVEIMPGIIPRITKQICQSTGVPIITGGLISQKSDIIKSLSAGAVGVSTTNRDMWDI